MSDMKGYPLQRLGELVSGNRGVSYKPEKLKTAIDDNSVVLLRSNNIQSGTLNFENVQIVPDSLVSDSQILKKGDIAVCMSNGSRQLVGKSGMLQHEIEYPLTVGAFCSVFRCQNEDDSEYVRYLFQSQAYQHGIDVALAGSAINNLKNSDIEAIEVPTAPKKLRKKIAEILSTIDNQIDATQALIDKYTAIKQGMMADLFSRGIDPETKALRPTFEEAPELYYKTPLGMLPKGWVCAPIKKFVQSAEYGISTSLNDDSSGIPVLRMNNIQNNRFNVEDLKFTKDPEAYRLKLSAGDVLYNRTNSMEHVGKTAIWRGELSECSFASYLVRINVNKCELLPEYFSFWMSQESSQNALRAFATPAVQQVNINPTNLQRVLMSCPVSLLEQREIVDRIDAADAVLLREREALLKLNAQKSALMQDLLTGKVPVPA
ncbi:TPA: restriction endonuclease subunit S [Vibrio parahaemolyticus]